MSPRASSFPFYPNVGYGSVMVGGAGNDRIDGSPYADDLRGGSDNDILVGRGGDDEFVGGSGDDVIWGGEFGQNLGLDDGRDRVDYSDAPAPISLTFTNGVVKIRDGEGGVDALHSIEEIVGSEGRDVFKFVGVIPNGHNLTIDGGGGQSKDDIINLIGATAGMHVAITETGGTLTSDGSTGRIELVNFHTQIIGSDYADTITDASSGEKNIDGGGGDDQITGGGGNDMLLGGSGTNSLSGGGGSDRLLSTSANDVLNGGAGHDYLLASAGSAGATLTGGGGHDVIDVGRAQGAVVKFQTGDGNDVILGANSPGWPRPIATIDLSAFSKSEVTFVWNAVETFHEVASDEIYGYIGLVGDLAIVIKATGESILLRNVQGDHIYLREGQHLTMPWQNLSLGVPTIIFSDGILDAQGGFNYDETSDFTGAGAPVALVLGSVTQYDTAGDYAAATAAPADSGTGTAGADDLEGGSGDDVLWGGDGDDRFTASGGNDIVDGGSGQDMIEFFGGRAGFLFTPNADGTLTATDKNGLEGTQALTSIEAFSFTSDDRIYTLEELFWITGTAGADRLEGTNDDDTIYGFEGNDELAGGEGNDRLSGGLGDDYLFDQAGDDIYHYALGDGADIIDEYGGFDVLILGEGISPADVAVSLDGRDIVFNVADGGSVVMWAGIEAASAIDEMRFFDGVVWTRAEIERIATGRDYDGVIDPLASRDTNGDGIDDAMYYGAGNPNDDWNLLRDAGAGVELGLKVKHRGGDEYAEAFIADGVAHYSVVTGSQPGVATRAEWNFDFAATHLAGGANPGALFRLDLDVDPTAGIDFRTFYTSSPDRLFQDSSNLAFFKTLIDGDPTTPGHQNYAFGEGEFNVRLSAFAADGATLVASNEIVVHVVDPALGMMAGGASPFGYRELLANNVCYV